MPLTRIKLTAIADGGITVAKLANPLNLSGLDVTLPQGVGGTNWTNAVINQSSTGATGAGYEVASSNGYFVDTTAGTVTIKLPASPTIGNYISLVDYAGTNDLVATDVNGYYTNRIQINPNGGKINGSSNYLDIGASRGGAQLVYVDSTQGWIVTDSANEDTAKSLIPSTPRINIGGIVNSLGFTYFQNTGDTITVTGSGFLTGVSVVLIDQIGADEYTADNIVLVNDTQVTFDIPAGVISSGQIAGEDPFSVKILNSNGSFVLQSNALEYAPTPAFSSPAADSNIGTVTNTTNDPNADAFTDLSTTVAANSLDPDDTVTFAITTLPAELTGLTIDANSGALSGGVPSAFPADDATANHTFIVTATATSAETSNTKTETRGFEITLEGTVSAPTVTSVSQTYISQSGTPITVTGTGFKTNPTITIIDPVTPANTYSTAATNVVGNETTQLTFSTTTAMANAITAIGQSAGDERFDLKVTNPAGVGSYSKEGTLADAFEYKPTPQFNQAAGSVGSLAASSGADYSTLTTTTLDATSDDPDDTIVYSLTNVATELANLTIDSGTGAISGTADLSAVAASSYNFTVVATSTSDETGATTPDSRIYSIQITASGNSLAYDSNIQNSLMFDGSSYLSKAFTGGDKLVHTVSFWVKRSVLGAESPVFSAGASANTNHIIKIGFGTTDALETWGYSPDAFNLRYNKGSNALYRDTSSWYHVVQVVDYSNQSGNDRVKLYVNGTQVTSFSTDTVNNADSSSSVSAIGNSYTYMIGRYAYASQPYFSGGYLANMHFIDGASLDPSYFGKTDTDTGVWIPKTYDGTSPTGAAINDASTHGTSTGIFGTNGFHLDFSSNSLVYNGTALTTVNDVSGRGNHWTAN